MTKSPQSIAASWATLIACAVGGLLIVLFGAGCASCPAQSYRVMTAAGYQYVAAVFAIVTLWVAAWNVGDKAKRD